MDPLNKAARHYTIKSIPVRLMRVPERTQRRFSIHDAQKIAAQFDPDLLGVIDVNARDGQYWVLDGQHRVAAIKLLFNGTDPGSIECRVFDGLSDKEAAEIFLGGNNGRPVPAYDKFAVACVAGHARECAVRDIVTAQGLVIGRKPGDTVVCAVQAILSIFDRYGAASLSAALAICRDAFVGHRKCYDGAVLEAIAMLVSRHGSRLNRGTLLDAAKNIRGGLQAILTRAEEIRLTMARPKPHAIATVVVDLYNKKFKTSARQRLPRWETRPGKDA